jgi:hypothetical protein
MHLPWSWASVDGAVTLPQVFTNSRSKIRVLEATIEPLVPQRYYGQIVSGTLRIACGQLKHTSIKGRSEKWFSTSAMIDLQGELIKGTWTFDIAERSLTCQLFLLMVDDLGPKQRDLRGLLIRSTGNQGEYSRVECLKTLTST